MRCLLESLQEEERRTGTHFDLLYNLGELWSEFMREIIPTLQVSSYRVISKKVGKLIQQATILLHVDFRAVTI